MVVPTTLTASFHRAHQRSLNDAHSWQQPWSLGEQAAVNFSRADPYRVQRLGPTARTCLASAQPLITGVTTLLTAPNRPVGGAPAHQLHGLRCDEQRGSASSARILIGVFTTPSRNGLKRRMGIRTTWMRWSSPDVLICFVIGRKGLSNDKMRPLETERAQHADMVWLTNTSDVGNTMATIGKTFHWLNLAMRMLDIGSPPTQQKAGTTALAPMAAEHVVSASRSPDHLVPSGDHSSASHSSADHPWHATGRSMGRSFVLKVGDLHTLDIHYSPLSAHRSRLSAHCSPATALCSALPAPCSLLTAHRSPLTAHCSLLTSYSLPLTADNCTLCLPLTADNGTVCLPRLMMILS
jgi:hypothetical protein